MAYPDGWQEDYTYDAIGQVLSIYDTDPSGKDMKQQKNKFEYDPCGNMTYEYMRGNGSGEATTEVFYTYDALHRVTSARETYGKETRNYQYDSLGNLTYEYNSNNEKWDYELNSLNQITQKADEKTKDTYTYSYDGRGNLVEEIYTKNKKSIVNGAYIYDETNKMVSGTNAAGEVSNYLYNGLGALVRNEWIIVKNNYGYHSQTATGETLMYTAPTLKNPSIVVKDYVVDYTTPTFEILVEQEVDGNGYKYVYGNDRLSVNITGVENGAGHILQNGEIRFYYHMDLRGTADYLTSPVSGKIESWTHYNEWGEITHNTVVKCGQREFDLVMRYATHDFDQVLGQYYAKARFYDAGDRRFVSVDPVKGNITAPVSMVQYLYVINNPLILIDLMGLSAGDLTLYVSSSKMTITSGGMVKLSDIIEAMRLTAMVTFIPDSHGADDYYPNNQIHYGYDGKNEIFLGFTLEELNAGGNIGVFKQDYKWNSNEKTMVSKKREISTSVSERLTTYDYSKINVDAKEFLNELNKYGFGFEPIVYLDLGEEGGTWYSGLLIGQVGQFKKVYVPFAIVEEMFEGSKQPGDYLRGSNGNLDDTIAGMLFEFYQRYYFDQILCEESPKFILFSYRTDWSDREILSTVDTRMISSFDHESMTTEIGQIGSFSPGVYDF